MKHQMKDGRDEQKKKENMHLKKQVFSNLMKIKNEISKIF